ncbi:MAG: DMT family transporter [Eubacteriales bacterium]
MNSKKIVSSGMLLLTACIWGVAFVAQSAGMDYIGPYTFNFVRYFIGAVVLIPVILFFGRRKSETITEEEIAYKKYTWIGGLCCGMILFVATILQQFGIIYTTVGKAGFITALYIIIVPILGMVLKRKIGLQIWVSAVIAVIGFYILCVMGQFELNKGDVLVLLCAFAFSIHIMIIDYFSPKGNPIQISSIQFAVCSILCGIGTMLFEVMVWSDIIAAWMPILYSGVLSSGVAYTLQIVGQKNMEPTVASLILSLESVVAVVAGAILLGETMTVQELIGCSIVFFAIILAQVPMKSKTS